METLTTVSLFIFGVVVSAILTAGLVFYQKDKDNNQNLNSIQVESSFKTNQTNTPKVIPPNDTTVKPKETTTTPKVSSLTLSMSEISKHNKSSDCWMLISGKVYNITDYFGSHPGGNSTMSATCGKDATAAYMTRDPYATDSGSRSRHSSRAVNLLEKYYIGDLNQVISN